MSRTCKWGEKLDNMQRIREPGKLSPNGMSSSNPFPEGLELYKRSQKDCNSQREWVIQKTVSCRHNRTHACSNRDCDSTHITCTDPIQMGDYCWDGEVDTRSHSQPRSYLQLMTICKEKITFSKRVSLGIRLHFLFWKVSLQFTFSFLIGPFAIIVFNFWITNYITDNSLLTE